MTDYFDLDSLHQLQLNLALEVKRICENHNIRYFLVDGSALGAVNLHDFLPWDDDLDIGMYWPDYQKFLKVCETELPTRYKMKDLTTDKSFGCSFGQLVDTNYDLVQENNQKSNDIKGVFIDIHPFSNCSSSKVRRFWQYYRFKFYKSCLLQRRNYMNEKSRKAIVLKFINRFISEKRIIKQILNFRNMKAGRYALKIHGRHPEDFILIENVENLQPIDFCGYQFFIQPDADRMLDTIYGDFDINKQEFNRHKILYLKRRDQLKT